MERNEAKIKYLDYLIDQASMFGTDDILVLKLQSLSSKLIDSLTDDEIEDIGNEVNETINFQDALEKFPLREVERFLRMKKIQNLPK